MRFNRFSGPEWGVPRAEAEPPPVPVLEVVKPEYFAGLDLGQKADFSALVVLERGTIPNAQKPGATEYTYAVRHLHRWKLGTPYPTVVDDVKHLYAFPPLAGTVLAVDETGVGRPVCDMFRAADIKAQLRPFSITCGRACTATTVAKSVLVSNVQAALSSGRLTFAAGLELTPVLAGELETFRVTVDQISRNESFAAWRERDKDDLVLALALAVFVANKPAPFASWVQIG